MTVISQRVLFILFFPGIMAIAMTLLSSTLTVSQIGAVRPNTDDRLGFFYIGDSGGQLSCGEKKSIVR